MPNNRKKKQFFKSEKSEKKIIIEDMKSVENFFDFILLS